MMTSQMSFVVFPVLRARTLYFPVYQQLQGVLSIRYVTYQLKNHRDVSKYIYYK